MWAEAVLLAAPGPPSGMVAIRRRVESRWSLRLPNPAFALVGKGWDEVLGALELPGSPAGKEARGEAPPQVVFSLSQHARVERQRTLLLNPPTPTTPTTQHNTDYKKKSSAARDHQRFGETTRPPTPGTRDKAHATSYMLHATRDTQPHHRTPGSRSVNVQLSPTNSRHCGLEARIDARMAPGIGIKAPVPRTRTGKSTLPSLPFPFYRPSMPFGLRSPRMYILIQHPTSIQISPSPSISTSTSTSPMPPSTSRSRSLH